MANENSTMNLGGAFPVITFDKLPAGMEGGGKGRTERTKYDWGSLKPKQGILVPGDKYMSAASSANSFSKQYPLDETAQKKLEAHLRGRISQAQKAYEATEEAKTKPWTDAMAKAVKPSDDFLATHSRTFRTQAVTDEQGKIVRTKALETKSGQKLADSYYIIRTN